MKLFYRRYVAFTLAEVLVTLGVLGVVAAMTMPTLMSSHQKKVYAVQMNKVYNELQQAFLKFRNDKNAVTLTEAGLASQADVNQFLKDYFKTVTVCDNLEPPCIPNTEYKNLNGASVLGGGVENVKNWFSNVNCGVLGSGATICIEALGNNSHVSNGVKWSHILVDTNGMKKPNTGGRDVFFIAYYENGTIDEEGVVPSCNAKKECVLPSDARDKREQLFTQMCKSSTRFRGCFGKLINDNWVMNY